MKPHDRHSLWHIVAGIATEVGFSVGLWASLCLLAYLIAAMAR